MANSCSRSAKLWLLGALTLLGTLLGGLCPDVFSQEHAPEIGQRTAPLRVALDESYPPYIFRDSRGNLQGILVDQWNLWQERMGLSVDLLAMDWGEALGGMRSGDFDVLDTVFRTAERETFLDFTPSYAHLNVSIFFHRNLSGISDVASLADFRVAVKRGDDAADVLRSSGVTHLAEFDSYEEIVDAAASGDVVLFVMDEPPALHLLYKRGIHDHFRRSPPLHTGFFHRAVHKGDAATLALVQEGFDRLTPEELRRIDGRWFGHLLDHGKWLLPLAWIAAGGGLLALGLLVWNRALNKAVLQKTAALDRQGKISEHRARALRESEERYRVIVEHTKDAICIHRNFRPLFVNDRLCEVLSRPREDLLAMTDLLMLVPPEEREALRRYRFPVSRKEKASEEVEFHITTSSGKRLLLEAYMTPLRLGGVRGTLVIARDVSERRAAEQQLLFLSLHDALTTLANRAFFESELRRLDHRPGGTVGLLVADVDGLKLVNDSFGHETGDALLVESARTLRESLPPSTLLARIGGDEFAALLPGVDVSTMEQYVRNILETTKSRGPQLGAVQIPLHLALGFAVSPGPQCSLRDTFRIADDRMYRDKLHRRGSTRGSLVQILKSMMGERDTITGGHGERMGELTLRLARAAGVEEEDLGDFRLFAQFHDIGKVGIPDAILKKHGSLTPEERLIMQRHPEIGQRIALSAPDMYPVAEWILLHHEWWNGGGYPLGLSGTQIPLACRVLSIVDAFDAMTNSRRYNRPLTPEEALERIQAGAGTQFDPELVELFLALEPQRASPLSEKEPPAPA